MIAKIKLINFKCFDNQKLDLTPLTLLAGVNGMGKTTALQGLLLLRQSYLARGLAENKFVLNGPLVSLGATEDAFSENAKKGDIFGIELESEGKYKGHWGYRYSSGEERSPTIKIKADNGIYDESLFKENFCYLRAERSGPRNYFSVPEFDMFKYNSIGSAGEYSAHYLSRRERLEIPIKSMMHPEQKIPELREQIQAWISEINPGTRIRIQEHKNMDLVNLTFSFVRGGLESKNFRATNVGFGLTYSLPIFIAVLSAGPGSLIIIENPEAHLHPRGQVVVGRFLALAAANGLQVVVETHSDHVLNGMRVAVKNGEIGHDKVTVHFFNSDLGSTKSNVITPKMDKNGRLDQWPEGFFDEWEKGLAKLL